VLHSISVWLVTIDLDVCVRDWLGLPALVPHCMGVCVVVVECTCVHVCVCVCVCVYECVCVWLSLSALTFMCVHMTACYVCMFIAPVSVHFVPAAGRVQQEAGQ
jgi:hypothetical protein